MPDEATAQLRQLAAALDEEVVRIDRCVFELHAARHRLGGTTLETYGTAALLDTFYTGVEKALRRVASTLGTVPEGAGWHRTLLEDAALSVPGLRPAVLQRETVSRLAPFLAFRHRFRNLYVYDLEPGLLLPLVEAAGPAWADTRADLLAFAGRLTSDG